MNRWVVWTIIIVCSSLAVAASAAAMLERAACRAATGNGKMRSFQQFTAKQLDLEVRSRVPIGTSRGTVESFLQSEGMKFSYDASRNALLANAPCIKGSGFIMNSLHIDFNFGSDEKLTSIESRVHLTGP